MQSTKAFLCFTGAMFAVSMAGCSTDQPSVDDEIQVVANVTGIPEHWDQISIEESVNGDRSSLVLKGKNQTLAAAIDKVKKGVTKPIKYADGVDPSKKLPEFTIEVEDGTWNELLAEVAETFGCKLEETEDAFVVTELR